MCDAPLTSRVLKGEWRVGPLLGSGACAEVYECTRVAVKARAGSRAAQADAGAALVVKVAALPEKPKQRSGAKARAFQDAKRAADTLFAEHLLYSNVLNRFPRHFGTRVAYGEDAGVRYLVLERLGPSLQEEVERLAARGERLAPGRLAAVGGDVLDALERMHHARYAYVDIKPENVLLGRFEKGRVVDDDEARLVDFGVACRFVSAVTGGHRDATAGGGGGAK
mmetsp:Transcript_34205/g.103106  ORF Transcript_34205/g.103106 Transcript_34205/m.103106 type:complete len:224 (+) Transcript_34205:163-834(+)